MFTPAPVKPAIEMADLEKIDVRAGTIVSVEEIINSDKLMKLTVSFGDHQRTIIAGIKQERSNPKGDRRKAGAVRRESTASENAR
jgi:tRNA-binding protein